VIDTAHLTGGTTMSTRALLTFIGNHPTRFTVSPEDPGQASAVFVVPALADFVASCEHADTDVTVDRYLTYAMDNPDKPLPTEPIDLDDDRLDLGTPAFHHRYHLTATHQTAWGGPPSRLHLVALAYDEVYGQFLDRALAFQAHGLYREAARLIREHADARGTCLRRHFGIVTDELDEIVSRAVRGFGRSCRSPIHAATVSARAVSGSTPDRAQNRRWSSNARPYASTVFGARPMFAVNCSHRRACSCPATSGNLSQMINTMDQDRTEIRFQIRGSSSAATQAASC
jgi:hypothetical protein